MHGGWLRYAPEAQLRSAGEERGRLVESVLARVGRAHDHVVASLREAIPSE
jgi:hypothetical protein